MIDRVAVYMKAVRRPAKKITNHPKHNVQIYWVDNSQGYYIVENGLVEINMQENGGGVTVEIERRFELYMILKYRKNRKPIESENFVDSGDLQWVMRALGHELSEDHLIRADAAVRRAVRKDLQLQKSA
jgi:hypothetical protein